MVLLAGLNRWPGRSQLRLAGRVDIQLLDLADHDAVLRCHQLYLAAALADAPLDSPPLSAGAFAGALACGWLGEPQQTWLARLPGGQIAGWYQLELPDLENLDQARLGVTVLPSLRRNGIGSALLWHARDRAGEHGRPGISGRARRGAAGAAFARAAGAAPGLADLRRVLDLSGPVLVPAAPPGYTLESWSGPVPEGALADVAVLYDALADAPHQAGQASSSWDAGRVRDRLSAVVLRLGLRNYAIAVRHHGCGELAALTMVGLDPGQPAWGIQEITAVTRPHRGHRLGLLVKLAMLDLLARTEPQLKHIVTNNAQANHQMAAVNDELGYRTVGPPLDLWQLGP